MYISLSLWTRDMKIFVTHVNIHERMTSAEKDLNNQVDILICSVGTNQPLSAGSLMCLAISLFTELPLW